jgi:multidrug resistance efflux pump
MPDNPSRREVWEAVVKDEEMRAASLSGRLAAMQARAEKAEADLTPMLASNDRYGAQLDSMTATVKALNARLAEAAPVVEAAERLEPHIRTLSAYMDGSTACTVEQKGVKILGELRSALRAARSLRGAGEGGGA